MKAFLFVYLLFFIVTITNAQNEQKIDSILAVIHTSESDTAKASNYIKLTDLTLYNNPKQAKVYIENSLQLNKKARYIKGLAKSYGKKATYFYTKSRKDSAYYYLNKSVDIYLTTGDSLNAATIQYNLGIMYLTEGEHQKCLDIMNSVIPIFVKGKDSMGVGTAYLMKGKVAIYRGFNSIALKETLKALKIHRDIKDDLRIAGDLLQLGRIYEDLEQYKKAIEVYTKSYKVYDSLGYYHSKAQSLSHVGHAQLRLQDYTAAKESFEKALEVSEETDYTANIARIYVNTGILEFEQDNYDLALENFEKGCELWRSLSNPYNEIEALLGIGKIYLAKKQYVLAIKQFNQSITIADAISAPKLLKAAYDDRAIVFEKLGKFKAAYQDHKKGRMLSDSLYTLTQAKAIEELNILYETEKREQEIIAKDSIIKILVQETKIKNLQQIILAIVLLLAFVIFIFGLRKVRKKMKQSLLEKRKLNTALHHTKKELTVKTLHIAKKNKVLENLKQEVIHINGANTSKQQEYKKIIQTINFDLKDDDNWENFRKQFEEIHKDFYAEIKNRYPKINSNELRLIALLKLNLSSKEIGVLLNISQDGVKKARYRLRKKMNLSTKEPLQDYILSI